MGYEDELQAMRELLDRMLDDAVRGGAPGARAPERTVRVRVPPYALPSDPEVTVGGEGVFVTWELGEASPACVRARVSGRLLLLEFEGLATGDRVVPLPSEANGPARWTFRNGVLDVALARKPPER